MNIYKLVCSAAFLGCLAACRPAVQVQVECVSRPDTRPVNTHYAGNKAPLRPLAFIKLPVGCIQPEGWVKEYLLRQRDGLSGQLVHISGWLEKKGNAWLSPDGRGDHGWEEVPYWLKGYVSLAYTLRDPEMINEAKIWLEAALNSQREDGYFGPWIEKNGQPDLWGNMIMLWCLQTYYEYTNDPRILACMSDYFKWQLNYPEEKFLTDLWEHNRAGDNLHSVYWLYNITGEKWLLDLAEKLHRKAADWGQDSNLPSWHNVNIAQCFREPATWWLQSKDSSDLYATYHNFHLVRRIFGQAPGGMFGSDENCRTGYIDPRQGIETCGMVEQMASDELLLRFTGDPFWADHCEDVAFNSYPAAVMPDFKSLRYITSPNMVTADSSNHHPGIDNRGPFLIMNPFSSRCCQHNHTQGWPYYAEHLWLATPDNGLAAMLFSAGSVEAKVAGGTKVKIVEETNYPFESQIRLTLHTPETVRFPLYIRIPSWCENARLTVNGHPVDHALTPGTYARILHTWKDGDRLALEFPMKIQIRQWPTNQQSVSVNYGPLTFSLKIKEKYEKYDSRSTAMSDALWQTGIDPGQWPSWGIEADSPWNYALQWDKQHPDQAFTVVKKSWPADNFPFTPENVPIEIKARGRKLPSWGIDRFKLCAVLPTFPVSAAEASEEITLIPMGAARLRISSFPSAD